ncbi:MAG TPA: hypothetical protein PLP73_04230 [Candidatus Absconditabacterales bacterium]|nr:hypothetical protein [Candidatus Absconditabacterales bacterium]
MFTTEAAATAHRLKEKRKELGNNCWLYKVADIGNTIKPCDILGHINGQGVAIEFKLLNLKREVTIEDVKSKCAWQQLLTLESYKAGGGLALLIGYNKQDNIFYQYTY